MSPISEPLRAAILASCKSAMQLGRESGVSHPVILRFVNRERDIRLETADKLARCLGLKLKRGK